ncbi:unnamed protein product [Callosobruchus maculatus]|uniref:Hexosyltransferase n=1 Tax=Callosobruchus maculatus TaxID=64391 RepID=A0A653D5G2_CALMS|nr:unnamed protein product [Callosobruchus maculatus]
MNFSKVKHPLCLLCSIGVTVFFLLYLYADTLNTGALKKLQFYRSNSTRFSSNPDQSQTVARSIDNCHKLLNISFRYKHLPVPCNESDRYVIAVHTSPDHLENRNVIRSTWGQKAFGIKVLFLIANATESESKGGFILEMIPDELLQPSIDVEASEFKDIIQSDFVDSYRNLSYKHVLALKFVVDYCSNIRYLIKVDDDSLVNTPNLKNFLDLYDSKYANSTNLLCNTMEYSPILRSGRWKVNLKNCSTEAFDLNEAETQNSRQIRNERLQIVKKTSISFGGEIRLNYF